MKNHVFAKPLPTPADIICFCRQVDRPTIEQAINQGANNLETITRTTGAGGECGCCQVYIKEMLGENLWQTVTLASVHRYSENYCAFRLLKTNGETWTKEMPGAYFILQALINGVWIGRPYAITDDGAENGLREITVKRKQGGFFSNWLLDHIDSLTATPLRASSCMGGSVFDLSDSQPIICLIGGVGITPILALCRIVRKNRHRPMIYIDYSAADEEDFFCRDELSRIAQDFNLHINFRKTASTGHIRQADIDALIRQYPVQRFYICGPENYKSAVTELLHNSTAKSLQIIDLEGSNPKAAPRRPQLSDSDTAWTYRIVGLTLSLAYCLQDALGFKLAHLEQLQSEFYYKIFSGSLLLAYILMQWRLPVARWLNLGSDQLLARRLSHKYFGAIAPLVFYLHATSIGVAYLAALSSIYLANSILGYCSGEFIDQRYKKSYLYSWTILHIGLSSNLLFLSAYHAYIALAYK